MYIFIGVLILLIFFLFAPISLYISKDDMLRIYVRLWYVKIPIKKKKQQTSADKSPKEKKSKKTDTQQLLTKIISLKDDIFVLVDFAASKCTRIDNLELDLSFGTGDAASTGVLYGLLNSILYPLVGVIHHKTLLKKWVLNINPDYEESKFSYGYKCIVSTRLMHIIRIGHKSIRLYLKFKKI